MNIFVGNLLFDATEADVKKLFEGFGNVASVVIAMEKEKKAPKSRGFGFVQMPDEQQALAAIAALNGKEFMGRVLNVNPARPKGQKAMVWPPIAKAKGQKAMVWPPIAKAKGQKAMVWSPIAKAKGQKAMVWPPIAKAKTEAERVVELKEQKKALVNPVFKKSGTYKGGRRSRSYMKRHGLTEIQEKAKPRRKSQENPMRWRKKGNQPRPWQKNPDESKPWKKSEGESKPWRKSEGGFNAWKKPEGESKPWKKPAGEAKPWSKSSRRPRKSGRR